MVVPAWLFVLLGCFSSMLFILMFVVGANVLRNWCRINRYERMRALPTKNTKATSFLKGYDSTSSYKVSTYTRTPFIPYTATKTVQNGRPLTDPSLTSYANRHAGTMSFEKKVQQNRSCSFEERSFNQHVISNLSKGDATKSSSDIRHDVTRPFRLSSNNSETSVGYMDVVTPAETIYLHSEFMTEDDPSSALSSDAVVCYEQESVPYPRYQLQSHGALSFTLEYRSSELSIAVRQATQLPCQMDGDEDVNSYVNLCIVPEDFLWKRTALVLNDCNPEYEEVFTINDVLHHKLREYTLCFYVMHVHPSMGERAIGKLLYPLSELRPEQRVDVTQELLAP